MSMPDTQYSFRQLLDEIQNGSDAAAWALVERYEPHIRSVLRRRIGPDLRVRLDSLDLSQAAWLSFFRHRSRLVRIEEPTALIQLVTGIVMNKLRHAVRDNRRACRDMRRRVTLHDDFVDDRALQTHDRPSQTVAAREKWDLLMAQQPDHYRDMVRLRSQGLTFVEIGKQLGCDERTVRRALDSIEQQYLDMGN